MVYKRLCKVEAYLARAVLSAPTSDGFNVLFRSTGDQQRTISGFTKEVTSIQFAGLSTNVVASCGDKNVHIKRADNGGNVRALSGATDYVYNVGVSGDGKTIVAGGQDSVVRIWSDDGKSIVTFVAPVADEASEE